MLVFDSVCLTVCSWFCLTSHNFISDLRFFTDAEAVTFSGSNYIRYSFDTRSTRDTSVNVRESYQESFSFLIRPRLATGVLVDMSNSERTEFAKLEVFGLISTLTVLD